LIGLIPRGPARASRGARFWAGISLAALCLSCGRLDAPTFLKFPSRSNASVLSLDGRAAKSGEEVSSGDRILQGETLLVEDGARVVLRLKDPPAAFQIKDAAKLVFESTGDSILLSLDRGHLLTVVRRSPKKFRIQTPAATVGVRGTAFYLESRAVDQTYLCLCDGHVTLSAFDTDLGMAAAGRRQHRPVLVSPGRYGGAQISPAPMINHTNSEIESLETALR